MNVLRGGSIASLRSFVQSADRTTEDARVAAGRRIVLTALLYAMPGMLAMRPLVDPDIWWHLRTGQWILQQQAVPWTDPFSTYGTGRAWIAYNWLFEVVVYWLYQAFGLLGPVIYTVTLSVAIGVALHAFVTHLEPRVSWAAALTVCGVWALIPTFQPRSFLFSILFFVLELHVLYAVRASGNHRRLLLLPLIFFVWANVHIQFIYGLFVLALAVVESVLSARRLGTRQEQDAARPLAIAPLALASIMSLGATLATPYHLHLHESVLDVVQQAGVFGMVDELLAMSFRDSSHWVVLGLAVAAAYTIGRRQRIEILPLLLFVTGLWLSFRSMRDVWVVVVAALLVLARSQRTAPADAVRNARGVWGKALVTVIVVVILVGAAAARRLSVEHLERTVSEHYPVAAAAFVEQRGYAGPLYNHYDWGGYLIWRLPAWPVAIDGRANLHGDERIRRSIDTWAGRSRWVADPELAAAGIVIAPADISLTTLLRFDRRFEPVYEDSLAVVFVRRLGSREPDGARARG